MDNAWNNNVEDVQDLIKEWNIIYYSYNWGREAATDHLEFNKGFFIY